MALMGKKVALLYHDHDPARVEIFLEQHSYGFITLLDERVNFRVRRSSHRIEIQGEPKEIHGGKLIFPKEVSR